MYELIFKRYAPFSSFGGGFHGDGRSTPSIHGSARTWGHVLFSFENGVIQYSAKSSPTYHTKAPSIKSTGKPSISLSNAKCSKDSIYFVAHTAGSNPLVPVAPDIDTFIDFEMTQTDGDVKMKVVMRGDDFPSGEVFLRYGAGFQTLIDFRTKFGELVGPGTRLYGAHAAQVIGTYEGGINMVA